MSNLLSANFMRLSKNKLFWVELALMFGFGMLLVLSQYQQHVKYGYEIALDSILLGYSLPIGVVMAVFSSLFLGTEYSHGTIRNKLVAGHSRIGIYFSSLITNIVVSFLTCLSFLLAVTVVGIPLFGTTKAGLGVVLAMLLGTFLLAVAFSSIFTLISMACGNKAVVAVISILGVVFLLLMATMINAKLTAPEFYDSYVLSESMENTQTKSIPNPEYLTGTKRTVYEFLYDFLPTGQSVQYSNMSAVHLWQMPLYSILTAVVTTVAGAAVFKRKDIK